MTFRHPFSWLSHSAQGRAFWIVFGLTIAVPAGMNIIGGPLNIPAAPAGIISFEFAGSSAVATEMMDSWGEHGRALAAVSLGIDYLFLVAYSIAISGLLWLEPALFRSSPLLVSDFSI